MYMTHSQCLYFNFSPPTKSPREMRAMAKEGDNDSGVGVSATERRFAFSLLEKLLEYVDKAAFNMKQTRPASRFSRRNSYSTATEDVKFFGKVNNSDITSFL